MLKNLLFTSLTSLYYAIIPVYFSAKLFPKRTNSKALISITIAVSIILLWFFICSNYTVMNLRQQLSFS